MKQKELWKELYSCVNEWIQLQPWQHVWSQDFVGIEINDTTYYCTMMATLRECIGLSIYEGEQGWSDLQSISCEYEEVRVTQYVMYDQTCLTFYMGNREEVPKGQKEMIKALGFKYRGRGNWPYFLSFQSRFYPYEINDIQAQIMLDVFKQLIPLMKAYMHQEVDVDFEEGQMLYAYYDQKWIYEARDLPLVKDKFPRLELTDKEFVRNLSKSSREFIIDLEYLRGGFIDEAYDRPLSGLVFLAMELESQEIVNAKMLKVEEEQSQECLYLFCTLLEEYGKPTDIYVRKPRVYNALSSLCHECGIEIHITPLSMIDFILDDMEAFM